MVKKSDGSKDDSATLHWAWISEPMWDVLSGKGRFRETTLLEQKETTGDVSDYLWYLTR
jgi:hypothetical protein